MSILEQLSAQDYEDGKLLRVLKDEEVWAAFSRLVKRLDDDHIRAWTDDEEGKKTKKWLRGAREALEEIPRAIEQTIQNALDADEEREGLKGSLRSKALDGGGSGDLSIS